MTSAPSFIFIRIDQLLIDPKTLSAAQALISVGNQTTRADSHDTYPVSISSQYPSLEIRVYNPQKQKEYSPIKFFTADILLKTTPQPMSFWVSLPNKESIYDGGFQNQEKYPKAKFTIFCEDKKPDTDAMKMFTFEEIAIVKDSTAQQKSIQDIHILAERLLQKDICMVSGNDLQDVLKRNLTLLDAEEMMAHEANILIKKINQGKQLKENIEKINKSCEECKTHMDVYITELQKKPIVKQQLIYNSTIAEVEMAGMLANYRNLSQKYHKMLEEIDAIKSRAAEQQACSLKITSAYSKKLGELQNIRESIKDVIKGINQSAQETVNQNQELIIKIQEVRKCNAKSTEEKDIMDIQMMKLQQERRDLQTRIIEANIQIEEKKRECKEIKDDKNEILKMMNNKINYDTQIIENSLKTEQTYMDDIKKLNGHFIAIISANKKHQEDLQFKIKDSLQHEAQSIASIIKEKQAESNKFEEILESIKRISKNDSIPNNILTIRDTLQEIIKKREEVNFKIVTVECKSKYNDTEIKVIQADIADSKESAKSLIEDTQKINAQQGELTKEINKCKEEQKAALNNKATIEQKCQEAQKLLDSGIASSKNLDNKIDSITFAAKESELQLQQQIETTDGILKDINKVNAEIDEYKSRHLQAMNVKKDEVTSLKGKLNALTDEIKVLKLSNKSKADILMKLSHEASEKDDYLYTLEIENGKESYTPMAKDAVDEKLGEYLKKHRINGEFKRLGQGVYLYGSQKLQCSIYHGRLAFKTSSSSTNILGIEDIVKSSTDIEVSKIMEKMENCSSQHTLTSMNII